LGHKGARTIGKIDRYGTRPDALSRPIEKPVTQVSSRCGSRPMSCGPHMPSDAQGSLTASLIETPDARFHHACPRRWRHAHWL